MVNGVNRLSPDKIAEMGETIYNRKLRKRLERKDQGKFVVIDVESGNFVLSTSLIKALQEASKRYPGKIFHTIKIGSPGVFRMRSYHQTDSSRDFNPSR